MFDASFLQRLSFGAVCNELTFGWRPVGRLCTLHCRLPCVLHLLSKLHTLPAASGQNESKVNHAGGHLNPAITLGNLIARKITAQRALFYWGAQVLLHAGRPKLPEVKTAAMLQCTP